MERLNKQLSLPFSPRPYKLRVYGLGWANCCGLTSASSAELWALVLYTWFICSWRWFEPLWWFFHKYTTNSCPRQLSQLSWQTAALSATVTWPHPGAHLGRLDVIVMKSGLVSLWRGFILLNLSVREGDVKLLLPAWAASHTPWEEMVLSADGSCEEEQVALWRDLPFPVVWWGQSWAACAVDSGLMIWDQLFTLFPKHWAWRSVVGVFENIPTERIVWESEFMKWKVICSFMCIKKSNQPTNQNQKTTLRRGSMLFQNLWMG